jgi:hypothetical protein
MICQHCRKELNPLKARVEWLASRYRMSMCSTIRVVHQDCQYSETKPRTMAALDLWDHWLPMKDLEDFLEIPMEMVWDNKGLAKSFFYDYINHMKQPTRVQTK